MKKPRRKLAGLLATTVTAVFKTKDAIEVMKERHTLIELAEKFEPFTRVGT